MIITLSGAGCTGKTTLLGELKKYYETHRGMYFLGEFIRDIFEEEYARKYHSFEDMLLSGSAVDIIEIHERSAELFESMILYSTDENILIFDRSPIDILIYLYMNTSNQILKNETTFQRFQEANEHIDKIIKRFYTYDPMMFYVRPFKDEVETDGFRPITLIDRRDTELALFDKEFLSKKDVELLPSSLEERVNIMKIIIDSLKLEKGIV